MGLAVILVVAVVMVMVVVAVALVVVVAVLVVLVVADWSVLILPLFVGFVLTVVRLQL